MISEKDSIRLSKLLSLVLRHQPEVIGITLDENGWTNTDTLIEKINLSGESINFEILKYIVNTNTKKRFSFNTNEDKIRANQGHSIEADLQFDPRKPPAILYHGTGEKAVGSILEKGIIKMSRQHVHLSSDHETAIKVGQRHGKPFVFEVMAENMHNQNYAFYLSENGVWLTDFVPVSYLKNKDNQVLILPGNYSS